MNLLPLAAAALAVLLLIWPFAPWAAENTAVTATTPTSDFVLDDVNGTAYHKKTGLTWKRCAEGQAWNGSTCTGSSITYTWSQALQCGATTNCTFAGQTGWRLPNLKELHSIVEQRNYSPAINGAVFPAPPNTYFWSASPYAPGAGNAWDVNFVNGNGSAGNEGDGDAVRLVRGGQYALLSVTKAGTGSGTVTSNLPGIDCGPFCKGSFASEMFVSAGGLSLTATPSAGSTFNGWTNCPSPSGNVCTLSVAGDTSVTANFTDACGVDWSARTLPVSPTYDLWNVAWSGNRLVAVGFEGRALTSTDGVTWSDATPSAGNNLSAIVWSGTQFLAVGDFGTLYTGGPGAWTAQTLGTADTLIGVTWTGDQFVAVGSTGKIFTSPTGVAWTARTSGTTTSLFSVAWSGEQLVAVGETGKILSSADGASWTARTSGTTQPLFGVAWSSGQFVAVGDAGKILTSPDGVTWTARTSGTSNQLLRVSGSGRQWVAVGGPGTILTSPDGVTWTTRTSGTGQWLSGVTWAGNQFVAVGDNAIVGNACRWGDGLNPVNNRWTQVGLPAAPATANVAGVFSGGMAGVYNTDWVLWRKNQTTNAYEKLPDTAAAVNQPDGYWLKAYTGSSSVNLTGAATPLVTGNPRCPSSVGCYAITLTTPTSGSGPDRANLISVPLPYPVGWWDVRVEVDETAAYAPSAATTWMQPTYYVYNGSTYDTFDDSTPGSIGVLQPWQGIWVKVKAASFGHTIKLLIPAIPKVSQAPAQPAAPWLGRMLDWFIPPVAAAGSSQNPANGVAARTARRNAEGRKLQQGVNWYVRFIAEEATEQLIDRTNVFGQLDGALPGYDSHDLPAPAPFGVPYLHVVFPHPEWLDNPGDYNSDYRPIPPGKGKGADQWRIEVRSDQPRQVTLRWEGPPDILQRSVLVDDKTGTEYNLNSHDLRTGRLAFTMTQPIHAFTWRYKGR